MLCALRSTMTHIEVFGASAHAKAAIAAQFYIVYSSYTYSNCIPDEGKRKSGNAENKTIRKMTTTKHVLAAAPADIFFL